MNIILFNGPPSSGKDTAAMHVFKNRYELPGSFAFDRMSIPIKRAFAGVTQSYARLDSFGNNHRWEGIKENEIEAFGVSYRQWQIDFSEKFMKPLYGNNIFAKLFVDRHSHRAHQNDYTVLVPDCGFDIEAEHLRSAFPKAGILIVKIFRPGKTFAGDSRNYLTADFGCAVVNIANEGTIAEFEAEAMFIIQRFLGVKQ